VPSQAMSEPRATASAWAPFRHHAFALIWTATVVSNVGGWMYNVASGWLMTSLDPDPFIVSMVQVANSLPMFLFAIPAGALVDIVDRRLFLICGEFAIMITSAAFAVLVWLHLITPNSLLLFSFIVTVGSAITAPAWQAGWWLSSCRGRICPRPLLRTAWASTSAVPSGRRLAASSPARRELRRRSGSMRSATLESSRPSYGGVRRKTVPNTCRPSRSAAPCAPVFGTRDITPI